MLDTSVHYRLKLYSITVFSTFLSCYLKLVYLQNSTKHTEIRRLDFSNITGKVSKTT